MSTLAWGVGCAVAVVGLGLVMARWRSVETDAARAERASRPAALRDAELVYMERLFRVSTPVGLVAKLDRAYRMPSGLLVLVEFKTRWSNQPFLSDVIQLSAQRMAVMGQTGQSVASYGYVMVKAPAPRALPTAHRVKLMTDEQVVALVRRREDVLAGRVLPRGSYRVEFVRRLPAPGPQPEPAIGGPEARVMDVSARPNKNTARSRRLRHRRNVRLAAVGLGLILAAASTVGEAPIAFRLGKGEATLLEAPELAGRDRAGGAAANHGGRAAAVAGIR